jgi:hypothetical protein
MVKERNVKTGWVWMTAMALCAIALVATNPRALATTTPGTVTEHWNTTAIVKIALTPNYNAGFGQVPAVIGTQPAPTHGPNALLNGGSVDFGTVLAGKDYLYKYATHLNVQSNSPTGVFVYGEGAADFVCNSSCGGTGSTTLPINQSVYYLSSVASGDTNTGFSAATPFFKTGAMVVNNSYATTPSIGYTVYPSPIAQSGVPNSDFYWDYQLKVPVNAASGDYFVWIVYTVVAK